MKKLFVAMLMSGIASAANAGAIIDNGTIMLGVADYGQLNFGDGPASPVNGTVRVGLRDLRTGYESTSHGCECEGWGVYDTGSGLSGAANNSSNGVVGLGFTSFTTTGTGTSAYSTATTATSITSLGGVLSITHAFKPSAVAGLYQVAVTLTNIGAVATGDLFYRRTFDWDIEPTAFNEYSTIQGTVGALNVVNANDNGFCSSNPVDPCTGAFSGNFVDAGPTDHGANFDLKFASLGIGESATFNIYYGAALTEGAALGYLNTVGAQIYSFGQSAIDMTGGNGSTFIFAFDGVGGVTVPGVPEPATWAMLITGFGLVGAAARRRRQAVVTA